MTRAVAIETSTRAPSVALREGGATRQVALDGARSHASDLVPALASLIDPGRQDEAVDAVLVGTGPGSYTGLRVGCATALGLARGFGCALRGVASTEALVFERAEPGSEAGVLIDARAGQLYFAHYRRVDDDVEVVALPRVLSVEELELPPGLGLFTDARALEAARATERARDTLGPPVPSASGVLALGLLRLAQLGPEAPQAIEPLYLRAFAARPRSR